MASTRGLNASDQHPSQARSGLSDNAALATRIGLRVARKRGAYSGLGARTGAFAYLGIGDDFVRLCAATSTDIIWLGPSEPRSLRALLAAWLRVRRRAGPEVRYAADIIRSDAATVYLVSICIETETFPQPCFVQVTDQIRPKHSVISRALMDAPGVGKRLAEIKASRHEA